MPTGRYLVELCPGAAGPVAGLTGAGSVGGLPSRLRPPPLHPYHECKVPLPPPMEIVYLQLPGVHRDTVAYVASALKLSIPEVRLTFALRLCYALDQASQEQIRHSSVLEPPVKPYQNCRLGQSPYFLQYRSHISLFVALSFQCLYGV